MGTLWLPLRVNLSPLLGSTLLYVKIRAKTLRMSPIPMLGPNLHGRHLRDLGVSDSECYNGPAICRIAYGKGKLDRKSGSSGPDFALESAQRQAGKGAASGPDELLFLSILHASDLTVAGPLSY